MNLKKPLLQPIWDKDPYGEAYFFSECHASGMVDDLNIQTRENGFVAWSAGWHESSWGGEDASGKILSWTMALNQVSLSLTILRITPCLMIIMNRMAQTLKNIRALRVII